MSRADVWLRLRALILRKRVERELQEEIDFHVAMQTRKNLAQNRQAPEATEARRRALVRFGSMSKIVEDCRDQRRLNFIDALGRDFRHAVRMLRRNPGFTVVAVLTLALAIGANTAIFTVADAVLFRPLPYQDPGHVYILQMMNRQSGERYTMVPNAQLELINNVSNNSKRRPGFSETGTIGTGSVIVPGADGAEIVATATVSGNYFQILGARAALGRVFERRDAAEPGRSALLAYSTWRQRFGGDENIIGRSIVLGPLKADVVGVLPADFVFPSRFIGKPEIVIVAPPLRAGAPGGTLYPIVRLDSGITREQAQSEIDALAGTSNAVPVLSDVRGVLYPFGGPVMRWLLAATTFVLLIGCANLANMLLVRSHVNEQEIGVRAALGAGRFQLIRPLILEAMIVSVMGATLALAMTYIGFDTLLARVPALVYENAPVGINLRVIGFALTVGLLASYGFSVAPAWRLFNADALTLIRRRHQTGAGRNGRVGRPMIVVQVALAVVLVFGAIMTSRTLISILQVPLGFTPDHVLTINVVPGPNTPTGLARQEFYVRLMETIARRGDVVSVGAAGSIAVDISLPDELVGQADSKQPSVGIVHTLPGYLETAGIPLRRGRLLEWNDVRGGMDAAIVSESAASVLFPGRDPIGAVFDNERGRQFTVVGVAGDVRKNPEYDERPLAYAIPGAATRRLSIVARLRSHQDSVVRELRRDVSALAPDVPVRTSWWDDTIDAWTAYRNPRFQTMVLGALAFLGLGLVALGIFGVIAFLVTVRTNEVGIRLALGAPVPSVVKLMVWQAVTPVAAGVVIGVGVTRWLARFAETQLFQVKTNDPLALAAAAVMVIVVAILASYMPARRASRVDPVVALRLE